MSKSKMINCKHCGAEIAAKAKVCPQCGGKNKPPVYKRGWFIALCAIVVIAAISSSGGSESASSSPNAEQPAVSTPATEIEYIVCTADKMIDDLDGNALKAENTYSNAYVELTGRLSNIDSDGDYISLAPIKNEWSFDSVMCYIKNDTQLQQVLEMSTGDKVTIRGQVKSIGEVMGYTMNIIEIVE